MGLFTPKYPKSDTPAVRTDNRNNVEKARDALNDMYDADKRGDTAAGERHQRTAQRYIDADKRR